jgi:phage tail sheath protein FI
MPEYLAPGVYVEETSFRSKSIEGVSTTTTGFIGPTRYGPVTLDPDIITSLGEFVRTYGDGEQLSFGGAPAMDNYTWHAARAFFTEGGKRLYVSRVFRPLESPAAPLAADGRGSLEKGNVTFRARYPGSYGNFTVRVTAKSGPSILKRVVEGNRAVPKLEKLSSRDLVWIRKVDTVQSPPVTSPPSRPSRSGYGGLYIAEPDSANTPPWTFTSAASGTLSPPAAFELSGTAPDSAPGAGESVRVVTLTIEVLDSRGGTLGTWSDLPLDSGHRNGNLPDSVFNVFSNADELRGLPIIVSQTGGVSALEVVNALFSGVDFADGDALERGVTQELTLIGGNDGQRPGVEEYEGQENPDELIRTGLTQFSAIDDISIVAAPGITARYTGDPEWRDQANAIIGLLLAHARNMRYRIAVIDSAQGQSIGDVRKMRAKLDSKYAAFYFPWVKVSDPVTRKVIALPPSGFVAGIYARNDITRAVFKAPANEVVNLSIGFEMLVSKAQQEVLNPEGINCFRFFEGRGMLLWGARTMSSDPEWKYVNIRRYFGYLEHSIDKGTQWAVFEPNGERLWANVRRTVEDFLLNEWQMGAMLGDKPEKAFFVRCDRSTMNQNDLDNGRLVCLIGVVAVKPAEFVIFRIGQWTADHKV